MITLRSVLFSAVLSGSLLFAGSARADGLLIKPSSLSGEARTALEAQIQKARVSSPKAFEAVKNVKGHRPEVYNTFRNPFPTTSREFRGLGSAALVPMLEALAVKAPERGQLTDKEWDALKTGMLEAVGILGDARARPVLLAAFEASGQSAEITTAVGRALGRLGGDAELALLKKHAVKGDPLLLAAVGGLGELRKKESAEHLAQLLKSTKDATVAQHVADAMGTLGSSWAWRTLGPKAEATGLEVRKICAQALVGSFARLQGKARSAAGDAIMMVEHPASADLLRSERASAGQHAKAIDTMIARVERQQKRARR